MAAVFISYRRGDKDAARALQASLALKRLTVFFDVDDIKAGDLFPERLNSALKSCGALLVVIGPQWVSADNLTRLHKPDDWVRQEIEHALARKSVRVIPVLMHDTVAPAQDTLPDSLRTLYERQFFQVTHAQWAIQITELAAELSSHLRGGSIDANTQTMPPMLPYLCDRVPQEDGTIDLLQSSQSITKQHLCILPGHVMEGHDFVVDRLKHQQILEDLFEVTDSGVAYVPLEWNAEYAKQGQFDLLLRRAIKAILPRGKLSKDEAIPSYFQECMQPHVFMLKLGWTIAAQNNFEVLRGVINAWQNLFTIGSAAWQPYRPMLMWINVAFEAEPPGELPSDLPGVLKTLEPIGINDINTWLSLEEVKPFTVDRQMEILQIVQREEYCISAGKLHMLSFANAIKHVCESS